jgi:LuxR family transcriptional regulator, maltose regulon positive regulatory protein
MSPAAVTPMRGPASAVALLDAAASERSFDRGLVSRARLVRRLMAARDIRLVLLTAPAGYGKTTTLLDWAQHDERPFAWVALDHADNDPDHLRASMARSTHAVMRRGTEFVLVVDDVHVLHTRSAIRALTALTKSPPDGCQLVLASRDEPRLALGRLRAHRDLAELTMRDFAMTRSEAAALLQGAGVQLGPSDVNALVQRTEGWPAGLYLAALSLREETAPIAAFGGENRLVADYIEDAVLADLSAQQVGFLLHTSVLDRLSGPLCDAVLGETGSGNLLKELARATAMVVPLDNADRWYRHHALLAQMLRAELRRGEPDLEPELHRRASRWHAARDDVEAAIRHAVAAGDVRGAGDLLWANALRYTWNANDDAIVRWLQRFTDEQTASYPPLALVKATAHLADGDRDVAEHWTGAAAHALRVVPANERTASLEAGIAVLHAAIARDGTARMRDDAARAYDLEAEDSPWRSLDCQLEGTARHLLGDHEQARALLQEGSRRGTVVAPAISALCLAQLALLELDAGPLNEAAALASRARSQVERFHLGDQPMMSIVLAVAALTRARLGQIAAASGDAEDAARLLQRLTDVAPWYRLQVSIVLARTLLVLSDATGARTLLESAAQAAGTETPVLAAWLDDAWAELDAYVGASGATPESLTTAELRVLRLLPTHLSFRELGSRLYVSPNTVKTQAQAIYRKLDASSRSQAVARARELGLLNGHLEL